MITFQKLITQLSRFWADHGCLIQQGHDLEVGAGTFNPATFLRSLGPEPFNTVYVEPSRRPQDGRFGDNPNRLQLFHQLQVVMKPSPLNIQELYIRSLEAIGFDLSEHDIRFVHDDWESPTLGAAGLGWEVWLDGMEVTQFTYFQQVAGISLNPISVELTYGLERLCMVLQKKDNFFDMMWNDQLTYGEVFHRSEVEWSHYNFYHSSTEMWLRHFDDFEKEANCLIKLNFPIPAYDFVLKASHAFNMLEARGVLSVTERASYIARVRDLSVATAHAYIASREALGYPLVKEKPTDASTPPFHPLPAFSPEEKEDFILEIGSEELPATFIPKGCQSLKQAFEKLLADYSLSYNSLHVYGAPRRLAIYIKELRCKASDQKMKRKGPPLSLAFDSKGHQTKQGKGFFESIGVQGTLTKEAILEGKCVGVSIQTVKGTDYLFSEIEQKGKSAAEILSTYLPKLIAHLSFPKKMRWASYDISYARPLSWILALHGKLCIPFSIAGVHSNSFSFGHRQLSPQKISLSQASDYFPALEKHQVIVDSAERKKRILTQLQAIEKETQTEAVDKETVLKEVLYMSEYPTLFHASFDKRFLTLPKEVLTSEMIKHQRYFPLAHADGSLSHFFVITADNMPNSTIRLGNEHVLTARLTDGAFLYEHDLKTSLNAFRKKLPKIIFQKDLGTLEEKTKRLQTLSSTLQEMLNIGEPKMTKRAADLAKADLASEMVQEFPDLQGTIGKYYALHQKEPTEVAKAIEEHWLPKGEKGALPKTQTGILLALADKWDSLIGYFSVGLLPTSSSDPYGLRRQTIGILRILIENQLSFDLSAFFAKAFKLYPIEKPQPFEKKLMQYVTHRLRSILEDYGFQKDEIEAGLQDISGDPYDGYLKTQALHDFRKRPEFSHLYEVYRRARGQLTGQSAFSLKPDALKESAEVSLYKSLNEISAPFQSTFEKREYEKTFALLVQLQKPLADLFDEVKILADDPSIRENRLALLQKVFWHFDQLLDFSRIQNT